MWGFMAGWVVRFYLWDHRYLKYGPRTNSLTRYFKAINSRRIDWLDILHAWENRNLYKIANIKIERTGPVGRLGFNGMIILIWISGVRV